MRGGLARRAQERRLEAPIVAGRVPPHDLDAEACCIERCFASESCRADVMEVLQPKHFYSDANGRIYEAIQEIAETGGEINEISVAAWLRDRERLAQIGGTAYIAQLVAETPGVRRIRPLAERVIRKWRLRQVIATCQIVAAEGYGDVGDEDEFIDDAEQRLRDAGQAAKRSDAVMLGKIVHDVWEAVQSDAAAGQRLAGVATGFERVDRKMGGWRDGNLYIVAGRPGMGKTSFVLNIAVNVAAPRVVDGKNVHGDGVFVASLEMPREQLGERMVSSESRVNFERIRDRGCQASDYDRIIPASQFLSGLPVWIDDTPAMSLMELRAKVRRCQAQWDREPSAAIDGRPAERGRRVRLVAVDYIQLMKGRGGAESREQEVAEISKGLKEMAKEFRVPVVALAQLNRAVETRSTKDKRPQLSDLRESGAIEQDADAVLFIYRDEYYSPETTQAKGIAEIIIAKHRHGAPGKVLVRFDPPCMRFDNLAVRDYPEVEDE